MATQLQAVSGLVCASASRTITHTPLFNVSLKLSGRPRRRPLAGWPAASATVSAGTMLNRSSTANAAGVSVTRLPSARWAAACICATHCASALLATIRAGIAIGADGGLWHAANTSPHRLMANALKHGIADTTAIALQRLAVHEPFPTDCGPWCSCRLAAVPVPSPCQMSMAQPDMPLFAYTPARH